MTKKNVSNEMIEGLEDVVKYMRGNKTNAVSHKVVIPDEIDIKSIRLKLKLSRQAFANRYGFSMRTLQHWEQGVATPCHKGAFVIASTRA